MTPLSYQNVATMPVYVHGRHELAFVRVTINGDAVEQTLEVNNETVYQFSLPLIGMEPQEALDRTVKGLRMFAHNAKEIGYYVDLEATYAS
jgi:hypothetical protein